MLINLANEYRKAATAKLIEKALNVTEENIQNEISFLAPPGPGTRIPKDAIQTLSDNYEAYTQKAYPAGRPPRPIRKKKQPAGPPPTDSKCALFGLGEIIEFLNVNGIDVTLNSGVAEDYAVRIYFGVHNGDIELTNSSKIPLPKPSYNGQLTAILVAAKKDNLDYLDILVPTQTTEGGFLIPLSVEGSGLEVGKLCPPDCGGDEIQ
ncbi:hypothetical protein DR864_11495 [Runella rosea]|uniref:Uncharacterized protein n=1 Tax=Runella rosea TaxID=2259595 RepID=A0A344TI56_9BACT|nr:hypothetical protein [Runella rosea]AXE18327.1 hypothetical protein DR864_11495 [Runella rosea]